MQTFTAITGKLAQSCRDALSKELGITDRVWLVREHRCGLSPKMYEDKPGQWIPINGGSLLAPEWSIARHLHRVTCDLLDPTKDWVPEFTPEIRIFDGLVCIDSEAYFPRLGDVLRDAPLQWSRMALDHGEGDAYGSSQHALSTYFTSFADQVKLCRPKARVGFYGLPTWRDGSLTDAVERRVDVTFPCCYTSKNPPYGTALDRVRRAKREAPTKPCIAFVCPFMDSPGMPPLAALEFSEQCRGAIDGGADGLCLWWDAETTQGLTKLLGQLDVIKAAMGATA